MKKIILIVLFLSIFVAACQKEQISSENIISNFDECVDAGNPIMESFPRQCKDSKSGKTFSEKSGNIGEICSSNKQCETPMEYLIQSNCPFGSACIDSKCKVVCPLFYHDPNQEVSKSYQYSCEKDSDCDCSERGGRTIKCVCLEDSCVSVEDE